MKWMMEMQIGDAVEDDCGQCDGGNENMDCDGVCGGDNWGCEPDYPPCLANCSGIDDVNGEDSQAFCQWVVQTLPYCSSSCDAETQEQLQDFVDECTECLAADNCDEMDDGDANWGCRRR
jgi:hypothetical protein